MANCEAPDFPAILMVSSLEIGAQNEFDRMDVRKRAVSKAEEDDRKLILQMAQKMAMR
jgi:hypothetical protein